MLFLKILASLQFLHTLVMRLVLSCKFVNEMLIPTCGQSWLPLNSRSVGRQAGSLPFPGSVSQHETRRKIQSSSSKKDRRVTMGSCRPLLFTSSFLTCSSGNSIDSPQHPLYFSNFYVRPFPHIFGH